MMMDTFLDRIIQHKRRRVESLKGNLDLASYFRRAEEAAAGKQPGRMLNALKDPSRINLIAEFKRASPSKGVINAAADPVDIARSYEKGGAAAISVLTEEDHFQGSLEDLLRVRSAVELPILRKDFVVDEYQIYESALSGADAVLLIVATLEVENIRSFIETADTLHLDTIVEVHDAREMAIAADAGAGIIGVNNRDLKTFAVSLDVSRRLIEQRPAGATMVAESGLSSMNEVVELHALGYSAFLVGETLMSSGSPEDAVRSLVARDGSLAAREGER